MYNNPLLGQRKYRRPIIEINYEDRKRTDFIYIRLAPQS
jgi:hypothetical protein